MSFLRGDEPFYNKGGMNREKFIEWCFDMHLQNTNGRETDEEMFKLGIEAAVEEFQEKLEGLTTYDVCNGKDEVEVCFDPVGNGEWIKYSDLNEILGKT